MEIDLLKAMYETSVDFKPNASEVVFKSSEYCGAHFVLRLPENYPHKGRPLVLSACDSSKHDLRQELAVFIGDLGDEEGEVLDVIFQKFIDLLQAQQSDSGITKAISCQAESVSSSKTVIIWLHHLLATSKRKLALHPSVSNDLVCGITKPGYPGVMLFTGPRQAINEHLAELKALNWQAFQIRYEEEEKWDLTSDGNEKGIVEVETMAEVVQRIPEGLRQQFLKAIGVK